MKMMSLTSKASSTDLSKSCSSLAFNLHKTVRQKAQRSMSCNASSKKSAVIIVDHGSRRKESNEQLDQFIEMYRASNGNQMVVAAHMEIASPSIKDAIEQCVEAGCNSLIIAPYFLSNGRHIQQDIPAIVAEASKDLQGIECVIADPIGLDVGVVEIIKQRVQAAGVGKLDL